MTKFSRLLTIAVTVLAVAFMGVALVTTATWTDWKKVANEQYPKNVIVEQQKSITKLQEEITTVEADQKSAVAGIEADVKALSDPATGREAELEKLHADLENKIRELAQQVEAEARKADVKLDELKLRREDVVRLQAQFDDLASQREASQIEVKRLQDLLFQARAMLERVERRRQWLEAEVGKRVSDAGAKKVNEIAGPLDRNLKETVR
jgi:chromosome segregation ATPase